jgi:hypothetical protein
MLATGRTKMTSVGWAAGPFGSAAVREFTGYEVEDVMRKWVAKLA